MKCCHLWWWWWSIGQNTHLLLRKSNFESRRVYSFLLCKKCFKRPKIKEKETGNGIFLKYAFSRIAFYLSSIGSETKTIIIRGNYDFSKNLDDATKRRRRRQRRLSSKKVLLQLWPQNFADSFPSFSSSLLLLSLNLRNKILKYFLSSSFKKICAQVNDDE